MASIADWSDLKIAVLRSLEIQHLDETPTDLGRWLPYIDSYQQSADEVETAFVVSDQHHVNAVVLTPHLLFDMNMRAGGHLDVSVGLTLDIGSVLLSDEGGNAPTLTLRTGGEVSWSWGTIDEGDGEPLRQIAIRLSQLLARRRWR